MRSAAGELADLVEEAQPRHKPADSTPPEEGISGLPSGPKETPSVEKKAEESEYTEESSEEEVVTEKDEEIKGEEGKDNKEAAEDTGEVRCKASSVRAEDRERDRGVTEGLSNEALCLTPAPK